MSSSIEELNESTSLSVLHGLYRVVMFNDRLTGEEFEEPDDNQDLRRAEFPLFFVL
jgi:hypothetical protein